MLSVEGGFARGRQFGAGDAGVTGDQRYYEKQVTWDGMAFSKGCQVLAVPP